MIRLRPLLARVDGIDVAAVFALALIGVGAAVRFGADVALIVVGTLLLIFLIALSRSEGAS